MITKKQLIKQNEELSSEIEDLKERITDVEKRIEGLQWLILHPNHIEVTCKYAIESDSAMAYHSHLPCKYRIAIKYYDTGYQEVKSKLLFESYHQCTLNSYKVYNDNKYRISFTLTNSCSYKEQEFVLSGVLKYNYVPDIAVVDSMNSEIQICTAKEFVRKDKSSDSEQLYAYLIY